MLGFLEKLTLRPDELGAGDADAVRAAGVSDEAMVDAVHVAALFNMITRLADSIGWDVPGGRASARGPTRCSRPGTCSTRPETALATAPRPPVRSPIQPTRKRTT